MQASIELRAGRLPERRQHLAQRQSAKPTPGPPEEFTSRKLMVRKHIQFTRMTSLQFSSTRRRSGSPFSRAAPVISVLCHTLGGLPDARLLPRLICAERSFGARAESLSAKYSLCLTTNRL